MPAQNCPNCGANLDSDARSSGRCTYCGTALTPPQSASNSEQQQGPQAQQGRQRSKRANRGFVFLWVFACFAMGISMMQGGVDGPMQFIPFVMGIVGANQMLRRDTSDSKSTSKRPRYKNTRGNDK